MLVGYLGLRPAELATLTDKDEGVAWIGAGKRNDNSMTKVVLPRVIAPMEIEARVVDSTQPKNGEGSAFVTQFASSRAKLPKALREQISQVVDKKHPRHTNSFEGVSDELRKQLDGQKIHSGRIQKI